MSRYVPERTVNRRRRLDPPGSSDITTIMILSVFMVMLTFFIIFVSLSTPNEAKAVGLMTTLEQTFKPLSSGTMAMTSPAPIPDWLGSNEGNAPLENLRKAFPDSFEQSQDAWGGLKLQFTPDRFQELVLGQPDLVKTLFSGLLTPLSADSDYMLEITIGLEGRSPYEAATLRGKTVRSLAGFGVHPTRVLLGYDAKGDKITLRMTMADRYRGAL